MMWNLPTVAVLSLLIVVLVLAVRSLRREGVSCGGDCASCGGSCSSCRISLSEADEKRLAAIREQGKAGA